VSPPLAALVAAAVAVLAWAARTLTGGGAVAAAMVGASVLAGTGWAGGAVLAAFFVSSSAVGRLASARPSGDAKGERRDHRQVAANGGPAALGALLALHHPSLGFWLVTGSLAGAAADTWATAIGALSPAAPRRLLLGAPVPAGTSGGMTALGTLGALAGAALVAGVAAVAGNTPALAPLATLVGFAGMAADSALGAVWQGRFHCPVCDVASEWRAHRCGARTLQKGGLAWLDNDAVNLAATSFAALLAAMAWRCWSR
jgi:uncharacterized protein (TIGR00297 family)